MDVGDQCGVRGRACLFLVQHWPEFTLSRFELNETWSFLLASFNLKIWGRQWINVMQSTKFSEKIHFWAQNRDKTKQDPGTKQTSLRRPSQPWTWERGNFPEVGKPLGLGSNPWIIAGAIFDGNCELQDSATCVFKKTEPQQTLNSLFSCLGSSIKDT